VVTEAATAAVVEGAPVTERAEATLVVMVVAVAARVAAAREVVTGFPHHS
jgi:hypothetical protein